MDTNRLTIPIIVALGFFGNALYLGSQWGQTTVKVEHLESITAETKERIRQVDILTQAVKDVKDDIADMQVDVNDIKKYLMQRALIDSNDERG